MEFCGLGWCLSHGGLWLALIPTLLYGIVAGIFGVYLSNKYEQKSNGVFIVIYALFLLFGWICMFYEGHATPFYIYMTIFFLIWATLFSILLITDDFMSEEYQKLSIFCLSIALFSILSFINYTGFVSPNALINKTDKEKANWIIAYTFLGTDSKELAIKRLEMATKFNEHLPISLLAPTYLKNDISESIPQSLRDYGKEKNVEARVFWEAAALFYEKHFADAAKIFLKIGSYDLAAVSLWKENKLELEQFQEMRPKFFWLSSEAQSQIMDSLISSTVKNKDEKLDMIINLLVDKITSTNNADIEAETKAFLLQEVSNEIGHFYTSENPLKYLFFISIYLFFLFLLTTFFTGMLIKSNLWKNSVLLTKTRKAIASILPLVFKLLPKSKIAEKVAVKLAQLEPKKGLFQNEIQRLANARFPFGTINALLSLKKAKKTLAMWELQSVQNKDLEFICQEISALAAKLIPKGNAKTLEIISALKSKTKQELTKYMKNESRWEKSRDALLEIISDLATVGDILGAKEKKELNYYHILGISPGASQDEVKQAYKAIVRAVHPDKNDNDPHLTALTSLINAAHTTLSNAARRSCYDTTMNY